MRILSCAVAALFIATTPARATPAENDAAMLELATRSGCMACHSILPLPKRADGLPAIAPAWRDIAVKYRDDPSGLESAHAHGDDRLEAGIQALGGQGQPCRDAAEYGRRQRSRCAHARQLDTRAGPIAARIDRRQAIYPPFSAQGWRDGAEG